MNFEVENVGDNYIHLQMFHVVNKHCYHLKLTQTTYKDKVPNTYIYLQHHHIQFKCDPNSPYRHVVHEPIWDNRFDSIDIGINELIRHFNRVHHKQEENNVP